MLPWVLKSQSAMVLPSGVHIGVGVKSVVYLTTSEIRMLEIIPYSGG